MIRLFSVRMSAAALLVALTFGCGDGGSGPEIAVGPTITANPNPSVPLAAIVELETDVATTLRFDVTAGEDAWSSTVEDAATAHTAPLLGLRPDTTYTIDVTVVDEAGEETLAAEPLTFTTEPLPDDFPPIEVVVSDPAQMEPGVTLFNAFRWGEMGPDGSYGLLVAVDDRGRVVWYYRTGDHRTADARRISNGNIVYIFGDEGAREIDMLGNTVREWHASALGAEVPAGAIAVDTDTIHHEIVELPSGNFMFLSSELRNFVDYPSSETEPAAPVEPADVVGDVIVEMTPEGDIVREWSLFDILDAYRIGYGSLGGFWNAAYADIAPGGTRDWTHANAVIYDESDRAFIVSVRHQDAVIKVDYDTGDLVWILGNHDNWGAPWDGALLAPVGDLEWQYHQHAPMLTGDGTLMLYDNGNFRASPFDTAVAAPDNYSRAVEFAIDEGAMEVTQVWDYGGGDAGEERFYSPFICDADWLPQTGNVLVTDGGRVVDESNNPSDDIRGGHQWARLVEVTRTEPPEKVFEIVIDDADTGWSVYRAERLSRLVP